MNQQIIDYFILYAVPLTTVGLGLIMGWVFKKFIHHRIKRLTEKTQWKGDDVIFEAIESHIVLWFFLVALNIASTDIPFLNTDYQNYLSKKLFYIPQDALIVKFMQANNQLILMLKIKFKI